MTTTNAAFDAEHAVVMPSAVDLVNLARYPILDLDGAVAAAALRDCHEQLDHDGSCVVKGFIKPEVMATMADQVRDLPAWNRKWPTSAFAGRGAPPPGSAPDHPHNRLWPQNVHAVANDMIPPDAMIKGVYTDPHVKNFLARVLNIPVVHEYADEFQCLNIMYMKDGGARAWHYDGSDFVVTLMLQPPEAGGKFDFAPNIRGNGKIDKTQVCEDEHYETIEALFDGKYPTKGLRADPGDLVIFNGQRSLHRVTAVEGPTDRIMAVLSYDTRPVEEQTHGTEELNTRLYGDRVQKIYQQRKLQRVQSKNLSAQPVAAAAPPPPPTTREPLRRLEEGLSPHPTNPIGMQFSPDEPAFDPLVHLQIEPPAFVKSMDFENVPYPYSIQVKENFPGMAYSNPFRLMSPEGTRVLRSIVDLHLHRAKTNERNTCLRGLGYLSRFVRNMTFAPEVLALLSDLANEPLWVDDAIMNTAHTNVGAIGSDKAVDEWHTDSTQFVFVLILSDTTDMVGGELQVLQLADASGTGEWVPSAVIDPDPYLF
jgi:hypothetical protein